MHWLQGSAAAVRDPASHYLTDLMTFSDQHLNKYPG